MPRRSFLWILTVILVSSIALSQAQPRDRYYQEYREFAQIFQIITTRYVDEVEHSKIFEGAFRGMLRELDPYSGYLTEREMQSFEEDTAGRFGGLGIEIGLRDGILTVISPIDGTPAWEAGVMPGDRVMFINGESTEGITLQEAVRTLRGEPGTDVTITVRRPDSNVERDIAIVRAIIQPAVVEYSIVKDEPKIAHIKIHSFTLEMMREFDVIARELKNDGVEGIVLDLRGNPGGILEAAVALSDRFLEEGKIVTVKGRGGESAYNAKPNAILANIPTVVLVDGGSASASEITAGALQDNSRALVVGDRTFGKGAVQNVIPLERSAIKLTTAMYYRPSSKPISRETPIEPDVVITMDVDTILAIREQRVEDKIRHRDNGEERTDADGRRRRVRDIQLDGAVSILRIQLIAARDAAAAITARK